MKKITALLFVVLIATNLLYSQTNLTASSYSDSSVGGSTEGFAEEEFRRGVQSYYRGAFNESIQEFEKALSYMPGQALILDWLGKAYYRAGVEGAALQQWQFATDSGYGGILLQNRMEIVSERRLTQAEVSFDQQYTESGSFPNINGNALVYSQPVSSLPNSDGSIWVVAYGSNEILHYDVNGVVLNRSRGPINGFDRPMDIVRTEEGNLLISEFAGDRLSLLDSNGRFLRYFGSKGRGDGQLLGPQYLAQDSFGNIYVTDFGNCRVVVYDSEGTPLLHFGQKTNDFVGFKSPTGIAIYDDRIFVADSISGAIYEFDRAGNYVGKLVNENTLTRPECIKNWGNFLIITDKNRILTVDTSTGTVYENGRTAPATSSITSAVPDRNGNIIVTDFKASAIYVMSKVSELVGGFNVQIEKVISDSFPNVTLEVKVENRKRQPIVGLKDINFLVTEEKRPVADMKLLGSANNNDMADVTFLIDRSSNMANYEEQVNSAVREVTASMNNHGRVQIISVGDVPVIEYTGNADNLNSFSVKALKTPYTENASLDQSIRLAVNNLVNAEKKRGVILISEGSVSMTAFSHYSLSDLTNYLNNNTVSFSTILLNQSAPVEELQYLTDNTTGTFYYVYRPEGLYSVIKDIIDLPLGIYQISYTSSLSTDYGRKYLPVEVETYLLNHSGKDESGYFAPLE